MIEKHQSTRELIDKLYHRCSAPLNGFPRLSAEEQAEAQRRFGAMLSEFLGEAIHQGIRSLNYHNEEHPCPQALRAVYRVFADIEFTLQMMEQEPDRYAHPGSQAYRDFFNYPDLTDFSRNIGRTDW